MASSANVSNLEGMLRQMDGFEFLKILAEMMEGAESKTQSKKFKTAQKLSPYCTYCKVKTHFFANCPSIFWFPRATPLPPGVNDTCLANTKCWSPSCNGARVSHWTRHCPNFDYRFIKLPSIRRPELSDPKPPNVPTWT